MKAKPKPSAGAVRAAEAVFASGIPMKGSIFSTSKKREGEMSLASQAKIAEIIDREMGIVDPSALDGPRWEWERAKVLEFIGSLPPGGSEFHDSPANCARWAADKIASQERMLDMLKKKLAAQRNQKPVDAEGDRGED